MSLLPPPSRPLYVDLGPGLHLRATTDGVAVGAPADCEDALQRATEALRQRIEADRRKVEQLEEVLRLLEPGGADG